jgi:hypothetical protein
MPLVREENEPIETQGNEDEQHFEPKEGSLSPGSSNK